MPDGLLGHTVPRIWTPPLRNLTRETSYGYAVIDFARDVLQEPLDPWQEWIAIHAGELLEDGRPRFRTVLILVARQNGKTHLLKVLALYWLFVETVALVVGMSTNLDYARESWEKAVEMIEDSELLSSLMPVDRNGGIRRANGEQQITTQEKARYKIAASNRRGGRSLSIDRLILDELREHRDWSAWDAAIPAMNARPKAQAFAISNQGDDESVVLDSLRDSAIEFINTGDGDRRLGLFEYSAPEGADVLDPSAWAAANPNLGRRLDVDTIAGPAARAKAAGGQQESGFRTEVLCQRVKALDAAIDPGRWAAAKNVGTLDGLRDRLAACIDVSPDGQHATLAVAATNDDGVTRVEVVTEWTGITALDALRRDLPGWISRVKPRTLGWFPGGPAASLAADLRTKGGTRVGIADLPGLVVEEIKAEVASVCMGLAEQVDSGVLLHSGQAGLDLHVLSASKLRTGDVWRFSRRGDGQCDAAYAAAGAVHLARTLPKSKGKVRIVTA